MKINRLSILLLVVALAACEPKVKVEAPDKPIEINLNIEHNINVQIDKDLEDLMTSEEGLF